MEPMSAFERQLARVASEIAGPTRPVDAVAVADLAKAAPVPRWSVHARWRRGGPNTPTKGGFDMFSALKFVTASVIVALFGGFLLSGILTSPQADEEKQEACNRQRRMRNKPLTAVVTGRARLCRAADDRGHGVAAHGDVRPTFISEFNPRFIARYMLWFHEI